MKKRISRSPRAAAKAKVIRMEVQQADKSSFEAPAEAEWHRMIAEAAYFHAQMRGFEPGHALDDWLLAEQEIKTIISP